MLNRTNRFSEPDLTVINRYSVIISKGYLNENGKSSPYLSDRVVIHLCYILDELTQTRA